MQRLDQSPEFTLDRLVIILLKQDFTHYKGDRIQQTRTKEAISSRFN